MKQIRILFCLTLLTLLGVRASAQELQVSAPASVCVGDQFSVRFVVNDKSRDFQPPKVTGATRIGGPGTSTSSSISFINGHRESSTSTTYTMLYQADREGSISFETASCLVDGKRINSKPFSLKAEKLSARQQQQRQQQQQQRQRQSGWDDWDDPFAAMQQQMQQMMGGGQSSHQRQQSQPVSIDKNSLFARASVSNNTPYEGQQIIVSYKVYTQVSLRQFLIDKLPGNKGFWAEDLTGNKREVSQWEETVNGKKYMVAEIRRGALFAQENGQLKIEPLDLDVLAMVPRQRSGSIWDLFNDPFFNMGQAVERHLKTNPVNVHVKPLPDAPEGFCGAVGNFKVSADVDTREVRANEAITYRITISGSGNLPLINTPEIAFPSVFEVYDPEVSDKISHTDNGVSGSRTFEWVLIPRNQGDYTIPEMDLSTFDPASGKYVHTALPAIDIHVNPGDPNSNKNVVSSKSKINMLNQDINHIHTHHAPLKPISDEGRTPLLFWIALGFIIIATILLLIISRNRAIAAQDIAGMRLKRSTREARKRLKRASAYLGDGKDERFYEEVYKAIWGCLADKYNIELSQLSSDTVSQCLEDKAVSIEQKEQIMQTLQEVDFARFGPGESSSKKQSIYNKALEMIRNLSFLLLLFALPLSALAQEKDLLLKQGDKAYNEGNYQKAIQSYESLIRQGMASPTLYYNLGNAYYRQQQLGFAILNYERALRLKPNDRDTRENLTFVQSKTQDNIENLPAEVFRKKIGRFIGMLTFNGWLIAIVILTVLSAIALLLYRLGQDRSFRKGGFLGGIVVMLLLLISIGCSLYSHNQLTNHNRIVVTQGEVGVLSAPEYGSALKFVIHEGTEASIDEHLGDWYRIHLGDGNKGWVLTQDVETI